MRQKCEAIVGHGINVFVNRQLIYNFPEQLFADAGIMAIEHADFDGIERLALVTGGQLCGRCALRAPAAAARRMRQGLPHQARLLRWQGGRAERSVRRRCAPGPVLAHHLGWALLFLISLLPLVNLPATAPVCSFLKVARSRPPLTTHPTSSSAPRRWWRR